MKSSTTVAQGAVQPVSVDETIAFLLRQNEEAKAVIAKQENSIIDLKSELSVERENSASVSKSYGEAQKQIKFLEDSNAALVRAVAVNESTVALLSQDNAKQKEKARKATSAKYKAYAVAGVVILLKLLIP